MDTKILLVGSGGYGAVYARQLYGAAHARENVRVAGVVDPYAAKGPLYEAICAAGTPIYNTVQEFYAQDRADLAVIATPIPLHREQASACLRRQPCAAGKAHLRRDGAGQGHCRRAGCQRQATGHWLPVVLGWRDAAPAGTRALRQAGRARAPAGFGDLAARFRVLWPRLGLGRQGIRRQGQPDL